MVQSRNDLVVVDLSRGLEAEAEVERFRSILTRHP